MKPVTVNICGCCLSRNVFNCHTEVVYRIESYVHRNGLMNLLDEPVNEQYCLTKDEVDTISWRDPAMVHNFNRRMLKQIVNGEAFNNLMRKKGDWIVIDTYYESFNLLSFQYPDGRCRFLTSDVFDPVVQIMEEPPDKIKKLKIKWVDANFNILYYIDSLCSFLKSNWGSNIILIKPVDSKYVDNGDTLISYNHERMDPLVNDYLCKQILDRIQCHIVTIPYIPISSDTTTVHYINLILRNIREKIDWIVTHTSDEGMYDQFVKIDTRYSLLVGEIKSGIRLETKYEYGLLKELLSSTESSQDKVLFHLSNLLEVGDPDSFLIASRLYNEGKVVEKDPDKAIEFAHMAMKFNVPHSAEHLYSILIKLDNDIYKDEIIDICRNGVEEDNPFFMVKLANMYEQGKLLECNIINAENLLIKASQLDVSYLADYAEFQVRQKQYGRAVELAVSSDSIRCKVILARLYSKGLGVPVDISLAISLMREVVHNSPNNRLGLCDMLLISEDVCDIHEAIDILKEEVQNKNPHSFHRLAQVYSDSRYGIVDIDKAISLYESSLIAGERHVVYSLFDLLVKRDGEGDREKASFYLTKYGRSCDNSYKIRIKMLL